MANIKQSIACAVVLGGFFLGNQHGKIEEMIATAFYSPVSQISYYIRNENDAKAFQIADRHMHSSRSALILTYGMCERGLGKMSKELCEKERKREIAYHESQHRGFQKIKAAIEQGWHPYEI